MSEIIQTNTELAELAYKMATDYYGLSKYRKDDTDTNYSWEYNVGKWEHGYWHSDCLGFVHIAVNGFKGDKSQLGGGAIMNSFVTNSDESTTLYKYCNEAGNFPKTDLKVGALFQNDGHVGLFIGEREYKGKVYNTAECTLDGEKGWILTYTDLQTGIRFLGKYGTRLRSMWNHWGYFIMIDYSENPEDIYTDVTSDMPSYKAIKWATEKGYVKGYPDGSFHPKDPVTREQLQIELWRMAGKPEV